MWNDIDYYEVLGVRPQATDEEIKSAYRALARRYHPDTSEQEHVTQMFRDVHEAYITLSVPARRAAYDRWRKEKGFDIAADSKVHFAITVSAKQVLAINEPQMFYVLLDITADADSAIDRLPFNLCLVVDHSTSMKGTRLQKVKESAREIIDRLRQRDIFALVAFNDRPQTIIPSQTGLNKVLAKSSLGNIHAGGGTEIYQGLAEGLRQVSQRASTEYVNHIILLTDGQTYGDEENCIALANNALAKDISISTIGIGSDWNDKLLDQIASISGGSSHYLARPEEINKFFQETVENLADIFAQKVSLTIRVTSDVTLCSAFRIVPLLQQLSPSNGTIDLGALSIRTGQSILLEILLPPRERGEHRIAHFAVTAEIASKGGVSTQNIERELSVSFIDELPEAQQIPQRFPPVLNSINLHRLQQKAVLDIEQGQVERATRRLELLATHLLDMGEIELARAALLEAGQLNRTGTLSPEGQKKLKYGTRSLSSKKSEPYIRKV